MKWFSPPTPSESPKNQVSSQAGEKTETITEIKTKNIFSAEKVFLPTDTLENDQFKLTFSNRGGNLLQAELKNFKESVKKDSPNIQLLNKNTPYSFMTLFSEKKLENIQTLPFKTQTKNNKIIYTAKYEGIEITKEYTLEEDYYVRFKMVIDRSQSTMKNFGDLIVPLGARDLTHDSNEPLKSWEIVAFQNDSITRKKIESLKGEELLQGTTNWLAFGNRYFSTALVNESKINPDVVLLTQNTFSGGYLRYPVKFDSNKMEYDFKFFMGPKNLTVLSKVPGLRQLIDYGMFSFLAYPMLTVLHFFYKFIPNYGLAIILLTIFVRILFYPLSVKSYRSMKEMQKIQPEILALKEKYKDDKERFNREQLALFKTHKVNPAGGCLPMLIQLPFFIALYALLANSIELFQAPFIFWIKDLTTKDPYYVIPAFMGVAMFIQQKITPMSGMDPAQQKIMLFMPIIFTFIMLNLPSGLTLYIFVSTILGVIQQQYMTRNEPAKITAPHLTKT
jgi:YidC/Oxa1 family membrane protein insertase